MALPYEGDTEFGRTANYDLVPQDEPNDDDAVKPLSNKPRVSTSALPEVFQPRDERKKQGCCANMLDAADHFKIFVSNTCCTCLQNVPSLALIICALVLVALLLATVPLVFVLTYQKPEAQTGEDISNVVEFNGELGNIFPNDGIFTEELLRANSLLPKNISDCAGFGYSCTNHPGIVISTNRRCDGYADCPDGSDELDCQNCQTSFFCYTNKDKERKICLRGADLCDQTSPCYSRSDEIDHCRRTCNKDEFKCPDSNKCLTKNMLCDGDLHCSDGADEMNCNGKCNNGAKWCPILKKCLPKWVLCNGKIDCLDGSDEEDCDCKSCSGADNYLCKIDDTNGVCISKNKVCDGIIDCPNGIDESDCPGICSIDDETGLIDDKNDDEIIECLDGKKYHFRHACSGLIEACEGKCKKCDEESAFTCKSGKCIPKKQVCDGINDCIDGDDEKNCECKDDQYKCKTKTLSGKLKCINQNQLCDGYPDCPNKEDEENCESCINNENAVYCKNEKKCLLSKSRCDGLEQCLDGSDELNCTCKECLLYNNNNDLYMCSSGDRCYRKNIVCNPHSICPNANKFDQLYCAVKFKSLTLL